MTVFNRDILFIPLAITCLHSQNRSYSAIKSQKSVKSANPFVIPSENRKRNETRYLQITQILREGIKFDLAKLLPNSPSQFASLFAYLDRLSSGNHVKFCEDLALLFN